MRSPWQLRIGLALAPLVSSALTVGCAETPAPVAPVVAAPLPAPPKAAVIDLQPVAEPADIVAVARWKSASATIASLGGCSGVPQSVVEKDVRHALEAGFERGFHAVDGKKIADLVALDAPVDLVATLDVARRNKGALVAFAVGLTSLDDAKAVLEAGGPLLEIEGPVDPAGGPPNPGPLAGYWRVGGRGPGELSCIIGPSAGSAPARLVCGPHDRDLGAIAPYLVRNVAAAALAPGSADLHAELRFDTIDARLGPELRRGLAMLPMLARMQNFVLPRYEGALADATNALATEGPALLSDLDKLTVDVGVDGNSCLTGSLGLKLKGQSSFIASSIVERSTKVGPPPAIFWHAPVDASSASYGHASDPARWSAILKTTRELVEAALTRYEIGSEADRKAAAGLLTLPVGKDASYVLASGGSGSSWLAAKPGPALVEAMVSDSIGWYMLGFDEGPAALTKLVKDFVAVYGRKSLLDAIRKALPSHGVPLPTIKLVAAPAQLGRGALDVEIRFEIPPAKDAKDPKKKPGGFAVHLLLMGEPKATWLAFGLNRDDLVKRLLAAKSGAPEAGTLAARGGLEPIRTGKALSSGFITLETVVHRLKTVLALPAFGGSNGSAAASTLDHLPHKGETPIFLVSNANTEGPRADVTMNVSRGSLEDLGAVFLTLQQLATNAGLLPP